MFLKSVQEHYIYLSLCLTTQLYWMPTGGPVIVELHNSNVFMELQNSNYGAP